MFSIFSILLDSRDDDEHKEECESCGATFRTTTDDTKCPKCWNAGHKKANQQADLHKAQQARQQTQQVADLQYREASDILGSLWILWSRVQSAKGGPLDWSLFETGQNVPLPDGCTLQEFKDLVAIYNTRDAHGRPKR